MNLFITSLPSQFLNLKFKTPFQFLSPHLSLSPRSSSFTLYHCSQIEKKMKNKSLELNDEEEPVIKESANEVPPMPEQCITPQSRAATPLTNAVYDVELQSHDPREGMPVSDEPVDERGADRGEYIAKNPCQPETHDNPQTEVGAPTSASPLISPSSDKRFWSSLHDRVESFLETRKSDLPSSISAVSDGDSKPSKRLKEDSMLLMRGFDSIASSISLLTGDLENALQGARELAKPSALTEKIHGGMSDAETVGDKQEGEERKGVKRKLDAQDCCNDKGESETVSENKKKQKPEMNLNKVKNLAVAMATKSASLAKELKSVKSDMCFLQERCALLEEENQRLRDGFGKGGRPDDDDLVRLQLEALLAEKSRLATDNANLTRENQCLRQLVEYHQFASEDLSASYEQVIQGISLDFSSPIVENDDNVEDVVVTPRTSGEVFEFPSSLDKSFAEEQELHNDRLQF